jgi:hypothetical protein
MRLCSALAIVLLMLAHSNRAAGGNAVSSPSQARSNFAGSSSAPKPPKVKAPKPEKQPRPQPPARFISSKAAFRRATPCPATGLTSGPCPGFVVDYIMPLTCGGINDPINIQWATVDAAKAQRKWERSGCKPAR